MSKHEEAYKELLEKWKEANLVASCGAVLHWDQETNMPKGGAQHRAEQMAYLFGMAHQKATDPKIADLIKEVEGSDMVADEFSDAGANLREIKHDYEKNTKLPQKFVEEMTRTTTISQGVWAEARKENDFKKFLPHLEKIIKLKRQEADYLGYEKEAYDALLDSYEPGMDAESIKAIFDGFRQELVDLVHAIAEAPKKPDVSILERLYSVDKQKLFSQEAAIAIGYDFTCGRLDIAAHPFTTGLGPGDTRITTRYNPHHFNHAFFGTLHEGGHGIYDQGLLDEHYGTPLGEAVSLGIHESQSRMWENHVGRGKPFWKHFFPRAQQTFPEALGDVKFDDFFFAVNDVRPSMIRVEADEVTYNLHIMLRFEIELAFLRGELEAKDLPEVWNKKFTEYFGITPKDDAEGCMQDVHWSSGLVGYFPTYSLGNLYAAQFYAKAEEEIKYLDDQFAAGNFSELKQWLNEKIHKHGQRYRAGKLVEVVTGNKLDHKHAMTYLKNKFGELYDL